MPNFFTGLFEVLRSPFIKEDELVDECGMWCTFLEHRHYHPDKGISTENASADERAAYDVHCYCGMIDSDGLACLLSQPPVKLRAMSESMRRLGLAKILVNTEAAAEVLKGAGLFPPPDSQHERVSELMQPFELVYGRRLRKQAYYRLRHFIQTSDVFLEYARNVQRCAREGVNCYDPKEWNIEHRT